MAGSVLSGRQGYNVISVIKYGIYANSVNIMLTANNPRHIGLLVFNRALTTSISLPMELFDACNQQFLQRRQAAPATMSLLSLDPPPLNLSGGLRLQVDSLLDSSRAESQWPQPDILIIASRWRHPLRSGARRHDVQQWLRRLAAAGCEICAVGNASYFLAEAGLLNGRASTTHWHYFDDFERRYRQVQMHRDHLITQAGALYCTGSVNSAADLVIHLIDRHWGAHIAQRVTRQFSPESRRPFASQAYRGEYSERHGDEVIALAQSWMHRHLADSIRIADLAARSGLSPRSFQRRFHHACGQSPLQYLQQLRLEAARDLLQNSNLAVEDISPLCGYGDVSYFGKLFKQYYAVTPGQFRRSVRPKLFAVDSAKNSDHSAGE